jgi:hypothetical protein
MHPDEARDYLKNKGAQPTAYLFDADGAVGRLYGAKTTPHMFVIDPEGVLIYQGAIDNLPTPNPTDAAQAENYVSRALDEAMSGKSVKTQSAPPYGCSVKYAS